MGVFDNIAGVFVCFSAIAIVLLFADMASEGWNTKSIWLSWFAVATLLTAAAFWFHGLAQSKAIADNAKGEQAASQDNPPGSANTQQINSEAARSGINEQQSSQSPAANWPSILNIVFAGAVAAATIILTVFGRGQLSAIRSQINQTKETLDIMRMEQRPWVFAIRPNLITLEVDKPILTSVVISNSGNTPAFVIQCVMDVVVAGNDEFVPLAFEIQSAKELESKEMVVQPGGSVDSHSSESAPAEARHVDGVNGGTSSLYLFGVIKYSDVFGSLHETRFCFVYNIKRKDFVLNRRFQYVDGAPHVKQ